MDSGTYEYPGMDRATFEAFASAPSPGEFYNENIKLKGEATSASTANKAANIVKGASHIVTGAASILGRV